MKLKTVRVRRSRPSALALALSLMMTMLCVYLISLSAQTGDASDAVSHASDSAEVRMEGLEIAFLLEARSTNQLEARVLAACCANSGGAGLILSDSSGYAVIREAVAPENAGSDDLYRSANALTLKLKGSSSELTAISDAVAFLRALACETGALDRSVSDGDTDLDSICSLLELYRTQGERALVALKAVRSDAAVVKRLRSAVHDALERLDSALSEPDVGKIKLIHAAACGEWISMLDDFSAEGA